MADAGIGIRMYTRPGCAMCDRVHDLLREASERYPLKLEVLNVEDDPALESRFGDDLPVVEVSVPGRTRLFRHTLAPDELESELQRLWNA